MHDRRPVVLNAEDAALWLDASMDAVHAEQLLRSVAVGPEAFAWYMVDRAVGNVKSEGAQLAQPVNVL